MRIVLLTFSLVLFCGCSGNTVNISDKNSALRLTDDGLYVNSALLGLPPNSNISVNTSSDNEITFNVENTGGNEKPAPQDSAFQ